MSGSAGRGLLAAVALCGGIVVAAVAVMLALAFETGWVAAIGLVPLVLAAAQMVPWSPRRRAERARRELRRRVADPMTLSGQWRRLLASAWAARDRYAGVVAGYGSSPIGERLADQQTVMDATLERCGRLAEHGHQLSAQLRAFRSRRMRRDLLLERTRNRRSPRAEALERQLGDVARLRDELDRMRLQLEEKVHDMRTAALRASLLRSRIDEEDDDAAVTELLEDLAHLREALDEVERPVATPRPRKQEAPSTPRRGASSSPDQHAPSSSPGRGAVAS